MVNCTAGHCRLAIIAMIAPLLMHGSISMAAESALPPHYAESVMIGFLSDDGTREISLRLARFPAEGRGEVWMSVATPEGAWSVADDKFLLDNRAATPVEDARVSFSAHAEDQQIDFTSSGRHGDAMTGSVEGRLRLLKTRDPASGPGTIPVKVDLHFKANSAGFKVRGRWELTGRVSGEVVIDGKPYDFHGAGKWHEQTGPRARFAPAFTYLNLENPKVSLLAIGFRDRVTGYVMMDGSNYGVTSFTVDGPGSEVRHFKITLSNQQIVEGEARVVQRWSVPIEGRRRPGSSVIADTNLGRMAGSLNDWDPGRK